MKKDQWGKWFFTFWTVDSAVDTLEAACSASTWEAEVVSVSLTLLPLGQSPAKARPGRQRAIRKKRGFIGYLSFQAVPLPSFASSVPFGLCL
jgi:hypothetical protein